MDKPLEGTVAIVTGCGRAKGIGRAVAVALARQGSDVAVTDISAGGTRNIVEADDEERAMGWRGLDSVVEEITALGRRAIPVIGDVGLKGDAERIVAETIEKLGQVDILVNNAGAPHGADRNVLWEVPEEAFDLVMRVNTKGIFLMSTAVIRHLLGREAPGRIINIASDAGKKGIEERGAYCASKFAALGLTQSMARELGSHNITVNAICPGVIATARQASRVGQNVPATLTPVARIGTPEDVARAVVFVAQPSADYITGQSISINGGLVM